MGYTTEFKGNFKINKKVDEDTFKLLKGLATTRRMKRDMSKLFPTMSETELNNKFGIDGEFFVDAEGDFGMYKDASVVNLNTPPSTQPGLWCQWLIDDDHETIRWDEGEKFYHYIDWIKYIINSILNPRGYVLNGEVLWQCEEIEDRGIIKVENNTVV